MTGNSPQRILLTDRDGQLLLYLAEAKLLDREQIQQLLDFAVCTQQDFSIAIFLGLLPGGGRRFTPSRLAEPRPLAMKNSGGFSAGKMSYSSARYSLSISWQ